MAIEIIVALIAFAGTAIGSFGGIIASSKLTEFRLKQLEKKVDEHNSFTRRIPVIEERLSAINHRVTDLENFQQIQIGG